MLVNIDQLSQEQTWGLQFELQQVNQQIAQENLQAQAYNLTRQVSQPEREIKPEVMLKEYVNKVLTDRANQAYQNLVAHKQRIAIELFNAAPLEKQAEALSILGVPDIVQ